MHAGTMIGKPRVKRSTRGADLEPLAGSAPTVLIIGGFLTAPFNYARVRRRILDRGAGTVAIAPIWPVDWTAAALIGFGPLLSKTRRAVLAAYRAGGERPILVVAHSGGGLLARLATTPVPLDGRRGGAAEAIGAIVTLGTPHRLRAGGVWPRHSGHQLMRFLERQVPGAADARSTGYLVLGSSAVPPLAARGRQPWWQRVAGRAIAEASAALVGPWARDHPGDGIVPAAAVHLPGAREILFDDVLHGYIGSPWYGDAAIIDRWWPEALDVWRGALAARARDGEHGSRPVL